MKQSKHDKSVEDILLRPYKIGIDGVIWRASNILWTPTARVVTLESDGIFFTDSLYKLRYHVFEYKSNDSKSNRRKAKQQLELASKYVAEVFGEDTYLYYVFPTKGHFEYTSIGRKRKKRK